MIYLASPYSHADPAVKEFRFAAVCLTTGLLMSKGVPAFSPIVSSHCVATMNLGLDAGWETWEEIDLALLTASDEVYVLDLEGWQDSRGVQAEVKFARGIGKPITLISRTGEKIRSL